MRGFRLILFCLAAIAPAGIAAPAAACVFIAPYCGKHCDPNAALSVERLREISANATRQAVLEALERDRAGDIDHAAELAEWLVPNIRPVWMERTSCGNVGEIDYGAGEYTLDGEFRDLVAGTPLAGSDKEEFGRILREDAFPLGPACNAEFRRIYADHLRRSLAPGNLRQAWLFLGSRQRTIAPFGTPYHRLVRFEGNSRMPPVRWQAADFWLGQQIDRALRLTEWGRSLAAANAAFWAGPGQRVADDSQACPATAAAWSEFRTAMVARMIEYRDGPPRRH